jgi:tetratricopeptide (TPR) repeat protein
MMKRALISFTMAAMFAGIAIAQNPAGEGLNTADVERVRRHNEAKRRLPAVRDLVKKHEWARAERELETLLAKSPELSEAHFLMAKVLYAGKRYPEALTSIESAEQSLGALGRLVATMQDDRRQDLNRRILEQDVIIKGLAGRFNLPMADRERLALAEQTKAALERELSQPPPEAPDMPAEYPFFHGNILLRLQKYAEAITKYEEALKIDPGYADAASNLASIYFSARDPEKALEVLTRAEERGATVNAELKKAVLAALPKR